jgi:hypothetical protein
MCRFEHELRRVILFELTINSLRTHNEIWAPFATSVTLRPAAVAAAGCSAPPLLLLLLNTTATTSAALAT